MNKDFRRAIGILAALGITTGLRAQGRTVTMLQQISALQEYIATMEDGYQVVENGIRLTGNIKYDEYLLHSDYYSSLQMVKPSIKDMPDVNTTYDLQTCINSLLTAAFDKYTSSPVLLPAEQAYINHICMTTTHAVQLDMKILRTLTTDDYWQMTDGERTIAIEAIRLDMQHICGFVKAFTGAVDILFGQKSQEGEEIQAIKSLYGMP